MTEIKKTPLTYADAGVNISAGNAFVERIKPIAAKTRRAGVMSGLGGFGALFELPTQRFKQPILVSSTDGVGTKLKVAQLLNKHDTIGIDLVAMCVNDLIVQGAEPLFFLDYFATGRLMLDVATEIMQGIGEGCSQAGAALIGGETAEMPGIYQGEDYDLAGFTVGIVEKDKLIDGSKVTTGDVVIALASSGPHANGFSLIRHIITQENCDLQQAFGNSTLGNTLLEPTRIYVRSILELLQHIDVHAMAHITGGGLIENIPRVLPQYTCAKLNTSSWKKPEIFNWLQQKGQITDPEMYRTFNCGVGMILCVANKDAEQTLSVLKKCGETPWVIGNIAATEQQEAHVIIENEQQNNLF